MMPTSRLYHKIRTEYESLLSVGQVFEV
jgi:hypothetical protein